MPDTNGMLIFGGETLHGKTQHHSLLNDLWLYSFSHGKWVKVLTPNSQARTLKFSMLVAAVIVSIVAVTMASWCAWRWGCQCSAGGNAVVGEAEALTEALVPASYSSIQ